MLIAGKQRGAARNTEDELHVQPAPIPFMPARRLPSKTRFGARNARTGNHRFSS